MPTLDITTSQFQNAYAALNGPRTLNISRLKCLKFAQTVGTSQYSWAFGLSLTALTLASYRAMAVRCVIDFTQPSLRQVADYSQLESTEKMNLSYWIGMTFCAIAADNVLGVPRTAHALHMGRRIRRANPASKSLADLVGQDAAGAWHVLEAKGRQTQPSANNQNDWKAQAATVGTINGAAIATGSYCVGLIANPCTVELVDPPPIRKGPVDIQVDPDELGRGYYRPYIAFLQTDTTKVLRDGRAFIVRPISFDPIAKDYIYVGLEDKYFFSDQPEDQFDFTVDEIDEQSLYVGTDGVAVATSSGPCNLT